MADYRISEEISLGGPYLAHLAEMEAKIESTERQARTLKETLGAVQLGRNATKGLTEAETKVEHLEGVVGRCVEAINKQLASVTLGPKPHESLTAFRDHLGTVDAEARETGTILKNEVVGSLAAVKTEVGTVREAFAGWTGQIETFERKIAELQGRLNELGRGKGPTLLGSDAGSAGAYGASMHDRPRSHRHRAMSGGVDTLAMGLTDPKSYEANYGFLRHELQTSHSGSLEAVRQAHGLEGKTMAFERKFEAAGVKHYQSRFKYARAAMGMPDGQPGVAGPDGGNGSVVALAGVGASGAAVDNAARLIGADSSQAASALGSRMTPGEWCADFVNGALKSANVRGVNSSIANSFLGWGNQVMGEVKKGDVLVEQRPRVRAMLVAVQVSSRNTSRAGSRSGWPANHASRAAFTSGRPCSAAWAVFFCT